MNAAKFYNSQEYTEDGEKKWYIFGIKYGIFKE